MFIVTVIFNVKPEKVEEFLTALAEAAIQTRREQCNVRYEISVDEENSERIILSEAYVDRTAFEIHRSSPYLAQLSQKLPGLLVEKPIVYRSHQLAK